MRQDFRRFLTEGEQAGQPYTLALPRQAGSGLAGGLYGPRAGSSLEFLEHRDYHPGDDLRHLDWSALGRSDKLVVKRFREEAQPHLDILLDGSRSMDLEGSAKSQAGLGLCAALAAASTNAGYTHAAWRTHDLCQPLRNGNRRPVAWEIPDFDGAASPARALARSAPAFRPRSLRVLCSDLLFPEDPVSTLSLLRRDATELYIVQVLAQVDVEPPERGSLRLADVETSQEHELELDASGLERYRNAFARHQDHWHRACRQAGATFVTFVAERLVRDWDLTPLLAAGFLQPARGAARRA